MYSPVYLGCLYSFQTFFVRLHLQLMIQNPTAVLMNHATSVNLNDLENARKLSIFALAICASSKIWSVTLRKSSSGSARDTASKYFSLLSNLATCPKKRISAPGFGSAWCFLARGVITCEIK